MHSGLGKSAPARATVAAVVALAAALAQGALAAPGDQAAFNYPSPPQESAKDFFTIAENGQARCVIIRPAKPGPREIECAETLRVYLDLATGASFRVLPDSQTPPDGMAAIHVGATDAAAKVDLALPDVRYGDDSLPNVNGYLVKTLDPRTLVIRGYDGTATMLGVVGFLKRYVGVRRYWPGEPGGLGDVVPRTPTLRLPTLEWRDWPCFISRIMSGVSSHGPKPDARFSRVRFDDFSRMNYTIPSNESYYKWLPLDKYGETHPEYFPLIGGKRHIPPPVASGPKKGRPAQGWQPCVSNPDVAPIMARALIEHFRQNPSAFAVNLAVNDGYGDCTCDKCHAMDAPGADMVNRVGLCDRYVKFNNQVCDLVAKEYPNKIIAFIAYGSMREPPKTVQLHPMLLPVLCVSGNAFEMWDQWMAMGARRMGYYFYHDDAWFLLPKMDVRQSAKRIRYAVASGRARHFYQEFYGTWPLDGMVGYVQNELLWDPRQDVDAIVNEYYTRFYGPAAGPMARFYDTLEAGYTRWIDEDGIAHPHGKDKGSLSDGKTYDQFKVLNPAEAGAARKAIDAAIAAAAGDETVSQRLDVVNKLFSFAEIGARQYWLMRGLRDSKVATPADADKILAAARQTVALGRALGDYKRDTMEKPPASLYAGHARDIFYEALVPGQIHPEALLAVTTGLTAIADGLRDAIGPQKAGDWLAAQRTSEKDPLLTGALSVAETKARGATLPNLVKDSSFEDRGAGKVPPTRKNIAENHEDLQGVNVWHSSGTPMNCALTTDEAHTGKYCVVFWDTQRAGISEQMPATPGERYAFSVWVKHNDKKGAYVLNVLPRSKEKMLARTNIPIPWKPGEWQEVKTDFLAPPDVATIGFYVFITGQEPGARIWIDDFSVGKYPE